MEDRNKKLAYDSNLYNPKIPSTEYEPSNRMRCTGYRKVIE